jgi:hypothetical protein
MWNFVVSPPDPSIFTLPEAIVADTLSPIFSHQLQAVAHTPTKSNVSILPRQIAEMADAPTTATEAVITTSRSVAICKGEGFFSGGKPRFISGSFRDTLLTVDGRDSILITELSILDCKEL